MQSFDTLDAYWQDIHNIPSLSDEEERALAVRIQQGDERAIDKLVTSNLRFVVSIARQYADKGLSMDDLISEGNIALMLAARKWRPDSDERFVNYAVWDVRKAMQEALPEQATMITLPKKGSEEEKNMRRFSTDAPLHPGQSNTLGDMLKAGKPMTDDAAQGREVSFALMQALRVLNEREQAVITAYYGIGNEEHMTMAEIAEERGLKRERVRQIRKTAERKMRRVMKQEKNTYL